MRQVVTRRNRKTVLFSATGNRGQGLSCDTYHERLIKYIPSETIVVYITLYGVGYALMGPGPDFLLPSRWLILAGFICTPLYLWKSEGVSDLIQLFISTVAFLIWAAALGVLPLSDLLGYNQIAASVLLLIYTFGIPLIDGIPEAV